MGTDPPASTVHGLGYLGIGSDRLEDWAGFASTLIGMQVADRSRDEIRLRVDDYCHRILVGRDTGTTIGWQVRDAAGLVKLTDRLDRAGVPSRPLTATECARRNVQDGLVCHDPDGNSVEFFYGLALATDGFTPGRPVAGFRTGQLGLGHVVLTVPEIDPMLRFYRRVLGFGLSDFQLRPFKAYFLHVNQRHHSLALIETGTAGVHHLMVEMTSFDDVGHGYDLAREADSVAVTLGRHSNDHMFSFYTRTPSALMVECGWGGRSIDPMTWSPTELGCGPSLWGHERSWLSPEAQETARQMRLEAAAAGLRANVHVREGNYDLEPEN